MTATLIGGPAMATLTPDHTPDVVSLVLSDRIEGNMCIVDLTIHRPTFRVGTKDAKVMATDEQGNTRDANEEQTAPMAAGTKGRHKKRTTRPQWILDDPADDEFWALIDENARQIEAVRTRFTSGSGKAGLYMTPMSRVGAMLAEFCRMRQERLDLASAFRDRYDTTYIDKLRAKFAGFWHVIAPALPSKDSIVASFDVEWTLHPLTMITADSFNLEDLNEQDRAMVLEQSNNMLQQAAKCRTQAILNEVFGTVATECDKILDGSMSTGHRKSGAIGEILDLLARIKNFGEFASPEVLEQAGHLHNLMDKVGISDINQAHGDNRTVAAIRAAAAPLSQAIDQMLRANRVTRNTRSLNV